MTGSLAMFLFYLIMVSGDQLLYIKKLSMMEGNGVDRHMLYTRPAHTVWWIREVYIEAHAGSVGGLQRVQEREQISEGSERGYGMLGLSVAGSPFHYDAAQSSRRGRQLVFLSVYVVHVCCVSEQRDGVLTGHTLVTVCD